VKVTKAIIPAAGLGTRFLPATKAQPKEMLPIVDKPTIQYIVEEAVKSGIKDILIISGRGKRAIEDHFDKSYELEETLAKKEKWEDLYQIQEISKLANIHYIRQKEPLGLGHAILCAQSFIKDEPFAVMLGDDVVYSEKPCLKQLIEVFDNYSTSVIGVKEVSEDEVSKYGVIRSDREVEPKISRVVDLIEKPRKENAPSRLAITGRYILTPEIFSLLERTLPGAGGEIQLTDALSALAKEQQILALYYEGERYDVGDKFGFIKATLDFALQREELKEDILEYMKNSANKFSI
jgi:UTP--glucose-1-phosphate uridylyltransferase